nr:MAG TPA: hypothetical protein [Caudoviricetes sp.]
MRLRTFQRTLLVSSPCRSISSERLSRSRLRCSSCSPP